MRLGQWAFRRSCLVTMLDLGAKEIRKRRRANINLLPGWRRIERPAVGAIYILVGTFTLESLTNNAMGNSSNPGVERNAVISPSRHDDQRSADLSTNDIDRRGAKLRAALEANYKKLVELKQIHPPDTDTTDVVTKYISVGMTFSEAEDVLRTAGFHIEPYPDLNQSSNPNRSKDWYAVLATVSPFETRFPFRVDLGVELLPKTPGDYTDVAKITASFLISSL
jgi:hypothetical protein